MGKGVYMAGALIFGLGAIWDIFTFVFGISSSMGGFVIQGNLGQIIVDLIFKSTAGTFVGILFVFVLIFLDFFLVEAFTEWDKYQDKPITWLILLISLPLTWVDFSTTLVGTARFFPLNIPENAEFSQVWSIVTSNSWNQMCILLTLSLVVTFSIIGFIVCIRNLRNP
jgi:hypothetical protein